MPSIILTNTINTDHLYSLTLSELKQLIRIVSKYRKSFSRDFILHVLNCVLNESK